MITSRCGAGSKKLRPVNQYIDWNILSMINLGCGPTVLFFAASCDMPSPVTLGTRGPLEKNC